MDGQEQGVWLVYLMKKNGYIIIEFDIYETSHGSYLDFFHSWLNQAAFRGKFYYFHDGSDIGKIKRCSSEVLLFILCRKLALS